MLIHQAPIGIAFFGPDLRFRRVNAALGEVIGKPDADHADKLPSEIWPEELAARAEAALRKVLADGTPVTEFSFTSGGTIPPRPPLLLGGNLFPQTPS
ncbi:MAG TPA: PAS domain-containing protein, partial [Streptosporangiaceae bacterium]|nr:PAS domain-containing protein [Streptosporangiaceae bacterium]